ncbi:G-protein coupled receptor 182-like [Paramisgurnus dabryanus]|uniref:G-protein coupled receptor 182-like n=1 Tax=Paramisgurnus dabryanus TaxID=90735 RepID=UPI0031F46BFB
MSGDLHNSSFDYNGTPWYVYECTIHLNDENRRIALFLLYLVLFVMGLAENSLVVWVNWRRRHSANGVLFCIINVSLSDLMVVFTMPFFMMEVTLDKVWLWGHFLCKVTHLVYVINFYSSSLFLAFMTLERYLSLTRPNAPACFPPHHKRRWLLFASIWLLSLVLALLENVHMDLLEWDEPGCYMMPENNHTEWYASISILCLIFQFLGPGSVIITCNILIARAVRTAPDVQNRRDVWLVHVYSLVFVTCWLPYHFVMIMLTVDDLHPHLFSCNTVGVLYFSFSVVKCLSLFHCLANPILYNFLSKSFRNNLINAMMSRISSAPASAPANTVADNTGTTAVKDRKLSNASTSHSDIGA